MMPHRATLSNNNLRRFILVTLSQADRPQRRHITQDEIRIRFEHLFRCTAIVIAREKHKDMTNHFHVSVLNENASRYTATRLIRNTFPEWEGRQCWVSFHKAWSTLCVYVTKHDKRPYVWGKFSLQQILQVASAACKHKKVERMTWVETLFQKLSEYDNWMELQDDPDLRGALWYRYNTVRRLWEDVQQEKQRLVATTESIVAYLWDKGWPAEYTAEELKEKYLLLDWVATNLVYQRPIMTKQLLVYGPPNTQKTLVVSILKKVLNGY